MIFRNHIPKQHYQNRIDDFSKATVVLQALIFRQTQSRRYLETDPSGPSTEYFEKDVQTCQETIDDLLCVFPDLNHNNAVKHIRNACELENELQTLLGID